MLHHVPIYLLYQNKKDNLCNKVSFVVSVTIYAMGEQVNPLLCWMTRYVNWSTIIAMNVTSCDH